MNAIQYFEWGGNEKNIPLFSIRAKDLFVTRMGRMAEGNFPFSFEYFSSISMNGFSLQLSRFKKFDYIREGNDLVCKTYILKSTIELMESRELSNFILTSGSLSNFPYLNFVGDPYIDGRPLKKREGKIYTTGRLFTIIFVAEYNDGEKIRFRDLLGKEIIIKDYYNI